VQLHQAVLYKVGVGWYMSIKFPLCALVWTRALCIVLTTFAASCTSSPIPVCRPPVTSNNPPNSRLWSRGVG
jgi:hypothetical protein